MLNLVPFGLVNASATQNYDSVGISTEAVYILDTIDGSELPPH